MKWFSKKSTFPCKCDSVCAVLAGYLDLAESARNPFVLGNLCLHVPTGFSKGPEGPRRAVTPCSRIAQNQKKRDTPRSFLMRGRTS